MQKFVAPKAPWTWGGGGGLRHASHKMLKFSSSEMPFPVISADFIFINKMRRKMQS